MSHTLEQVANLIDKGYSVQDALRSVSQNFEIGNSGTEKKYVRIQNAEYRAGLRINGLDGVDAQMVVHRHSTTFPAIILGSRSKSDGAGHANVASGDTLFSLIATGWGGTSYYLSSVIDFKVGTGTVSNTSMPGEIHVSVAADGSVSPSLAVIIKPTTINLPNIPTSSAGLVSGDVWSNAGVLTIV